MSVPFLVMELVEGQANAEGQLLSNPTRLRDGRPHERSEMPPHVFISHAAGDRAFVASGLIPLLTSHSIRPWHALRDITAAADWEQEILSALKSADRMIVVLSERSVSSKWVRAEVAWWLDEKYAPEKRNLIPILIEPCDWKSLHVMMRSLQYIDCTDDRFSNVEVRDHIVACFGVRLRRVARTVSSQELAALPGPILLVRADRWSGGATFPVETIVSSKSLWADDGGAYGLTEVIASDLGPRVAADIGDALVVAQQPTRGTLTILFDTGVCILSRSHGNRLQALQFIRAAVPKRPGCAAVLPDGRLALGYEDGSVYLINWLDSIVEIAPKRGAAVVAMGTSQRTRLVIAWGDGRIEIRRLDDIAQPKTFELNAITKSLVCQHALGEPSFFAVGGEDGRIRIVDYDGITMETLDCSAGSVTQLYGDWGKRLSAIAGGYMLQWSINLSEQLRGSYLEYVWPIELPENELTAFVEAPLPGTRPPGAVESMIVLGSRHGVVTRYMVGEAPL